jgi:hypothetical protein
METTEETYLRVYKRSFRVMLKHWTLTAQYIAVMYRQQENAEEWEITLPLLAPSPGFFDISDPQSGLCRLIREAVAVGYLRGNEDWLEPVNWKEGDL